MAKLSNPDKGKSVAWYIDEKLEGWQQDVAWQLHDLIVNIYPAAQHSVKWAQPVYSSTEGPMLFMKGAKKHLTFGFWQGAQLQDPNKKLEGSGEKMRHLKIKGVASLDLELISDFVQQAIDLNAKHGDPTKG